VALEDLDEMIGRRVLVGITYLDASGEVVERDEFAGTVRSVDPDYISIWTVRAPSS
jgi:hypothetical protein